jgi:hypothetical protein
MSLLTNISNSHWLSLGAKLVGLTFIWTGAIKAVAPHTFQSHLDSLGWISPRRTRMAVAAVAGLEVGLGVALVIGTATSLIYPFGILLLVVLSAASWWGVQSGKAIDCGCYGGFADPSIKQSIGMNAVFALLLLVAWITAPRSVSVTTLDAGVVGAFAVVAAGLAAYAQRYNARTGRLLVDTNPLKVSARWRDKWAGGATRNHDGEMIVAFLGPDCPFCAQWVRMGNAISQSPKLPRVFGVVAATRDKHESFVRENGIKFPVSNISQSLMGRLAQSVPTTVLVKGGRIEKTWIGSAPPPEFVDRLKDAFFPNAQAQGRETSPALN